MAKKKPPYYEFGRRIRAARKELNMTQRALAAKVFITPVYMNRIERGHNMPAMGVLRRLATILKTNVSDLLK